MLSCGPDTWHKVASVTLAHLGRQMHTWHLSNNLPPLAGEQQKRMNIKKQISPLLSSLEVVLSGVSALWVKSPIWQASKHWLIRTASPHMHQGTQQSWSQEPNSARPLRVHPSNPPCTAHPSHLLLSSLQCDSSPAICHVIDVTLINLGYQCNTDFGEWTSPHLMRSLLSPLVEMSLDTAIPLFEDCCHLTWAEVNTHNAPTEHPLPRLVGWLFLLSPPSYMGWEHAYILLGPVNINVV